MVRRPLCRACVFETCTRFQSPCAGNMFGKALESALGADEARATKLRFQSPCAGNMFGKETL